MMETKVGGIMATWSWPGMQLVYSFNRYYPRLQAIKQTHFLLSRTLDPTRVV